MKLFRIKDIPYVGLIDEDTWTPMKCEEQPQFMSTGATSIISPPLSEAEALKFREQAMKSYEMAKLTEAAFQLSELLDSNPNDAKANYNLGVLLHTSGWSALAVKYLLKVVECSPEDSVAHSVLKYVDHHGFVQAQGI